MNDYDVSSIFKEMEEYLINSMMRNMKRHTDWEIDEGFQWEMWQSQQLEALNDYRNKNAKYVKKQSGAVKLKLDELLKQSNEHGGMQEEIRILEAIKKGAKLKKPSSKVQASFFRVNERKLNALIDATTNDLEKASTAMLRKANDEYRRVIFKDQLFANVGTITYDQAIDRATKEFLSKGINCIKYSGGRTVNIVSYTEMAIRTANKRAYLQGEGNKRNEWGIHTVLVSQYGACSPTCLPWQGRVYVDDVWSGGTKEEAARLKLPLLSEAIAQGLFHPNCRHTMTTYIEGITEMPKKVDVAKTKENSQAEAQQRYNERQIRKYKRLETNSLDPKNKEHYASLKKSWQNKQNELVKSTDGMKRNYKREAYKNLDVSNKREVTASKNKTPNYSILNEKELAKLQETSDTCYNKLTVDELDAVDSYTVGGYQDVNEYLSGRYPDLNNGKEFVSAIDSAVDKFNLEQDVIAFRGTRQKYFEGVDSGDEFETGIFFSTSAEKKYADEFFKDYKDPLMLEIRIPKGTKSLYIGKNSDYEYEGELLLSRKCKYKVVSKEKEHMILEVLNDEK